MRKNAKGFYVCYTAISNILGAALTETSECDMTSIRP